jgi:S1-C subfamily serine protease
MTGGAFSDTETIGNVGMGILGRFTLTVDYAHQVLFLEPDAHSKEPFLWSNTCGIVGQSSPAGFLAREILAPSPAMEAGLKPGDTILEVNGQGTHDIPRWVLEKMLCGEPGSRLSLKVRSGSEERRVELICRDLL